MLGRLYHVPNDVLDGMGVLSSVGKRSIILVMLFVNLLVKSRIHVKQSVRPVEESILHDQTEQQIANMLPTK